MRKKLALFFILLSLITIMVGCGQERKEFILDGYYSSDEYFDEGFRKYTDYCKYYYNENADQIFAESQYYTKVAEDNICGVKKNFEDFPSEFMSEPDKYDFDSACITEGDFYCRYSEEGIFDVCLYDVETHTLYYIHNND